ncbi:phage antirepressor KilAC domain-containing protein [Gluconobacter oxydans]|uniref:phage antirepressor KilAC domain-containing protein n=1 Tax=Gluconobacter oxydans TaxID=442 RepID=UPI0007806FFC|nr:phage regulatory protein/antirepressor Ant [Gluconobacter oxydans]
MNASLANIAVTMSSREIAELTDKRHDHVIRDIEKLLDENEIDRPKFGGVYLDAKGEQRKCYNLPKDLTITLVAGYRSDLRLKIVRRWMELEAAPAFKAPTNMREALMLALDQQEEIERQKALIDAAAPKVAALDRISAADGSYGLTEAAKILQIKPKALIAFMATSQWIYRRNGTKNWLAFQAKIDAGYLWHKIGTYTDGNGEEKTRDTVKVLPKGLAKLAQIVPGAKIDPDLMEMEARPTAGRGSEAMEYVPLDTAERQQERAQTKAPFITTDMILMTAMDRWEAMRWSGAPQSQEDADMWYEINDYTPKTPYAHKRKDRFLGLFPYTAIKRSGAARDTSDRLNKCSEAFERRNERIGEELCK